MGLALLGDKITARHAMELGLIWECVADDAFAAHIDTLAAQLASGPTPGYARTKQAIYASPNNTFEAQLALEGLHAGVRLLRRLPRGRCGVQGETGTEVHRQVIGFLLKSRPDKGSDRIIAGC